MNGSTPPKLTAWTSSAAGSMVAEDAQILAVTGVVFDGLYEYHRRALLLGRDPA